MVTSSITFMKHLVSTEPLFLYIYKKKKKKKKFPPFLVSSASFTLMSNLFRGFDLFNMGSAHDATIEVEA